MFDLFVHIAPVEADIIIFLNGEPVMIIISEYKAKFIHGKYACCEWLKSNACITANELSAETPDYISVSDDQTTKVYVLEH